MGAVWGLSLIFILLVPSPPIVGSSGRGRGNGWGSPRVQVLNGSPYISLKHGIYFGKTISARTRAGTNGGDKEYHAFLGIRYAATPQRFEKSEVMSDLDMMPLPLLAQSLGSPCPQISQDGTRIIGKEDCLFGNVYVPTRDPPDEDGFPVIVFIHPGSFKSGSGAMFNVEYFMRENVICATFNFRLGALGFLETEDTVIPDSIGLRDQITFLQWIKDNIEVFGGNKKRITIAGIESGANSVKYLLLSQFSKGLFQSAIIHGSSLFSGFPSGSDLFTSSILRQEFSDELECPFRPSRLFAECLKIKRLKDLMQSQKSVSEKYFNLSSPFLPGYMNKCGSNKYKPSSCLDSFFPRSPTLLIQERQYKRVPLLVGMSSVGALGNSGEGLIPVPLSLLSETGKEGDTLTSWLLEILRQVPGFRYNLKYEEFITNYSREIRQLYFNGSGNSANEGIIGPTSLTHFLYDGFVHYQVWKFALTYAHDKPVYPYLITFQENRTRARFTFYPDDDDVSNGGLDGIINYESFPAGIEFLTPSLPYYHEFETDSDEEIFSKDLVHLWTTFAAHQKPVDVWRNKETWLPISAAQLNGEKPLTWYSLENQGEMKLVQIEELFTRRMKFWDRLFKEK